MSRRLALPKLYVILDSKLAGNRLLDYAQQLVDAGVRLLQHRDKKASAGELLSSSRELASMLIPRGVSFVVNDRPDVAVLAGASGVHIGQEDVEVEQAREVVGAEKWVGISTHNLAQFTAAAASSPDYIAVGPVFATSSKANPDPVVGLELVRSARGLTDKPIVAIGGITLETAASIIRAGADSVAVIGDILGAANPGQRARQFLELLDAADQSAAG